MHDLDPGIADQDVDATELVDRGLHRGINLVFAGHVDGYADCLRPVLAQFHGRRIGGVLVQVGDDDVSAFARKHDGDFAADAARGAGDECDFVFQLHG